MSYDIDEKKVLYANLDPTEGVVLNLESKNYYRLNETGQVIWQDVAAKKSTEEIVAHLCADFDISEQDAIKDVQTFVHQLQDESLVESQNTDPSAPSVTEARKAKKKGL